MQVGEVEAAARGVLSYWRRPGVFPPPPPPRSFHIYLQWLSLPFFLSFFFLMYWNFYSFYFCFFRFLSLSLQLSRCKLL